MVICHFNDNSFIINKMYYHLIEIKRLITCQNKIMPCLDNNCFFRLFPLIKNNFFSIIDFFYRKEFGILKFYRLHLIHGKSFTILACQAKLLDQCGQQNLAASVYDNLSITVMEFYRILQYKRRKSFCYE